MNKVEELKQQIQNLSHEELDELRSWFWEQASLLDAAWLKEAEDRLAAYRAGELEAVDAEGVFVDDLMPLAPDERAKLDRCLDAYEADGNPGRLAEDVIADIKKKL